MDTSPVEKYRLTVENYHRLGEVGILDEDSRVELIEGELIKMAPIGSKHAAMVADLAEQLILAVSGNAKVYIQNPLLLSETTELQPDIAVLKLREQGYAQSLPTAQEVLFLIEVSESTIRYDRETKVPLYAQHRVPEVWLLDLQKKRLEVYYGPETGEYQHVDYYRSGKASPQGLSEVTIDIGSLWHIITANE